MKSNPCSFVVPPPPGVCLEDDTVFHPLLALLLLALLGVESVESVGAQHGRLDRRGQTRSSFLRNLASFFSHLVRQGQHPKAMRGNLEAKMLKNCTSCSPHCSAASQCPHRWTWLVRACIEALRQQLQPEERVASRPVQSLVMAGKHQRNAGQGCTVGFVHVGT